MVAVGIPDKGCFCESEGGTKEWRCVLGRKAERGLRKELVELGPQGVEVEQEECSQSQSKTGVKGLFPFLLGCYVQGEGI